MTKHMNVVPKRYLSVVALFLDLVIGSVSAPITDMDVWQRLWSAQFS